MTAIHWPRWQSDRFPFSSLPLSVAFSFFGSRTAGVWRTAVKKSFYWDMDSGTLSCVIAPQKIKQSKEKYEDERLSLLGDSFSIYSFVIVAAALCRKMIPRVSYYHLTQRMGISPGAVITIRFSGTFDERTFIWTHGYTGGCYSGHVE